MVGHGADSADSSGYYGQVFSSSSFAEFFEAAEFWNLEVGFLNVSFIIQKYGYFPMSFKPCYRVYNYLFHFITFLRKIEFAREYL